MDFVIPVEEMSIEDKLIAMEQLWADLCRKPESIQSPDWHENVLLTREKQIIEGSAEFSDLIEVKDRIRKSTK